MSQFTKSFAVHAKDYIRGGDASIQIQGLLKTIGFDADFVRRVSVCAYEAEMNVVLHGGNATLMLMVDEEGVVIDVKDDGPGIENIELALTEGYSTASEEQREMGFGAGMGLPNIKKNADRLEIESERGKGTHVRISFGAESKGG